MSVNVSLPPYRTCSGDLGVSPLIQEASAVLGREVYVFKITLTSPVAVATAPTN